MLEKKRVAEYKFINQQNILKVLESENIDIEKQKCIVCGKNIRGDNIGSIISKNSRNYFTCKDTDCVITGKYALQRID